MFPGCVPGTLNSRTYNINIESSAYTCDYHRKIRQLEIDFMKRCRQKMNFKVQENKNDDLPLPKQKSCIYEISSSSEDEEVIL